MIDADKVVILDHHDLHLEAHRMHMAEEDKARKAGRGIWSGDFVEPEQWRRGRRGNSKPGQMPRDKDCGDFQTWQEAQSFFETAKPGDPHRLDGDRDGIACESLRH